MNQFKIQSTIIVACLVAGVVATSAIAANYAGRVQLRFGADGIQVQVDGRNE